MATEAQTPNPAGSPPASPASPAPPPASTAARAADPVPPGSEDARFIAFAKENIGLLASVASVPLLSSAAGALKPPMQMDQLTVLSSLLCVIVFAACFTLRGVLGAAPKNRHTWVKAIPGVVSLLVVGFAVWQVAAYSSGEKFYEQEKALARPAIAATAPVPQTVAAPAKQDAAPAKQEAAKQEPAPGGATGAPKGAATGAAGATGAAAATGAPAVTAATSPAGPSAAAPTGTAATTTTKGEGAAKEASSVPDLPHYNLTRQIILFLWIYPTLILALGLILVTNFTQQTARDIQTVIEQALPEQAPALLKRIQLIARFYEIGRQPGQERFLKIGEALIEDRNDILKKLSESTIELGGAEAMRLQQVLVQTFKNSFDAVSCRDLKFWADIGTDELSRNYFRLNLEALKRSDKVTRLLIFDDNEIARIDDVIKALVHHQRYGIAWAVVPYMDLDPSTREEKEDLALDFGLYDESEVAIYFRDYHSGVRKLRAVFPGPAREDFLARQRQRYAELLAQCWLVSSSFLDRLSKLPPAELAALKYAAIRNSVVTARELELVDQEPKFAKLLGLTLEDLRRPDTVALQDCYLFPNCESDIAGNVERMYRLRSKCRDWAGPAPTPPPTPAVAKAAGQS
jgi:hypothetical protein